jgi:catechol-2,3-dioxygenase
MRRRAARILADLFTIAVFALAAHAQDQLPPKIDHILLEVTDLNKSMAFYHDLLGLEIKSAKQNFRDAAIR